jgi:hypothetical protein
MAMTGVMLADFSAFRKEADESSASLKKMESGADTAATKLSKIGEGVNIKSTINDPLGTASTVATGFAESLGAVGVAAAATAVGVGVLGGAMFALGEKSAKVIAEFDDLADKTGMSVPALSRLSNAAAVVGADMGQLTNVVFKLQQGIGENTDAFQKGLAAMGLSTETLRAEGPDRYLETVAAGLKSIEDPAARAAAGTAVLGRGYRDVAAALNDLATGYEKTAAIEPFTAKQAADAEALLFQINALKVQVSALGVAIGGELIGPLSTMVGWIEKLKGAYDALPDGVKVVLSPMNLAKAAFNEASAAIDVFTGKATELPTVTGNAAQGVTAWHNATAAFIPKKKELTDAIALEKETTKGLNAETQRQIDITNDLNASAAGWQATLDTIDGKVVEGIKFYLSAGVSQGELAKAYGLTAQQVKAVAISLDDYATALNATADLEKAELDRRKEINAFDLKATNDRVLAEFQKKQAAEASEAAFLKANLADAQAQDAIQQGVKATTNTVLDGLKQREIATKRAYEEAVSDATVSAEKIKALGVDWQNAQDATNAEIKKSSTDTAGAVGDAFSLNFKRSANEFENFKGVVVAGTAEMIAGVSAFHDSGAYVQMQKDMRDAQRARGGTPFIDTGFAPPPIQTRDSGGPVVAGTSYLIGGGKAPEIFTPGATGFVTPNAVGGVHVNNVFNIVDTESNITRRVADNITRSIMAAQKL